MSLEIGVMISYFIDGKLQNKKQLLTGDKGVKADCEISEEAIHSLMNFLYKITKDNARYNDGLVN